jgi:hypothetical protein
MLRDVARQDDRRVGEQPGERDLSGGRAVVFAVAASAPPGSASSPPSSGRYGMKRRHRLRPRH